MLLLQNDSIFTECCTTSGRDFKNEKLMKLIFLLLCCISLQAQDFNGNILAAQDGKVVFEHAYGYADFPSHKRNTLNSRFNLASVSKVFTSTAILQLMEKGKLRLDDPFQSYFPDFPFPDITIRHLLCHQSGLPDLELFEALIKQYPDTVVNSHTVYDQLKQYNKPLYFKPGAGFEYCNNGYILLSLLVEELSGQTFGAYLQRHIFRPARMTHTLLTGPGQVSKHAYASFAVDTFSRVSELKRYKYTDYNNGAAIGASDIITTVGDMLLFDQAFFGCKLLTAASIQLALKPVHTDKKMDTMEGEGTGYYCMGWEMFDQPFYGRGVGHGGFKFGLATFYYHNLDKNQTIIAFDNTAGNSFGKVVTSALHVLNNQPALEIHPKKSLARVYTTTLVRKGADAAAHALTTLKYDSANYYLSEWEMNRAGYEMLYDLKKPELAVEIFRLNCLQFPLSYNTYDSYGEALNKIGKKKEAIEQYERSIQLNPKNEGGIKALKEIKGS
jgi:CubicO group peptidase (beta-lactamase class C family)